MKCQEREQEVGESGSDDLSWCLGSKDHHLCGESCPTIREVKIRKKLGAVMVQY